MIMSDIIEKFIKEMFDEGEDFIEIQRNDLAGQFNCVPSQINYVISTRFTPKHGYYVESRRGGGGNIKITKVNITRGSYLIHILNNLDDVLSQSEVDIVISNLLASDIISSREAKLLKVATSDKVLLVEQSKKDAIRGNIFKNMLLNLVEE